MRVLVAEKPSVARDLARTLAPGARGEAGLLRGDGIVLTWALGHLLELAPPEAYDPALRRWRLESLPILPERHVLQPRAHGTRPPGRGRGQRGAADASPVAQLARIRRLLAQPGVEEVVNACDAGREGERIFREILSVCPTGARLTRLWLSETTPAAIRRAWADRQPLGAYDRLAAAAQSRAEADWVVGMNATRALTVHHRLSGRGLLTAGRVQTPTLALLVAREAAVRAFRAEPYFTVHATFVGPQQCRYDGRWIGRQARAPALWATPGGDAPSDGQDDRTAATGRLATRAEAEAVAARIAGRPGVLAAAGARERREAPPLLFNLNDLQGAANRRLGLTARQTLEIAQRLYEAGLISYPRTDSRHITPELAATMPARLRAAGMPPAAVDPRRAPCVDARRVTDHYGLVPTEKSAASLRGRDRSVWDLVARRAAEAFQEAAVWREARALTRVGDDWLTSESRMLAAPGWRALEPAVDARAPAHRDGPPVAPLPLAVVQAAPDTPVQCVDAQVAEHATRPPARYTDATLLRAMERAGQELGERALRKAMAGAGLGTAATRAEILESLVRRGYVRRDGRSLVPSEAGEALVRAVPDPLRSAELTARWEERLAAVERGSDDPAAFAQGIAAFARAIVTAVAESPVLPAGAGAKPAGGADHRARRTDARAGRRLGQRRRTARRGAAAGAQRCPRCGGAMVRTTAAYACQGSCGARVSLRYSGRATLWSDVEALLGRGRTEVRRGFRRPEGTAPGRLVLEPDGTVRIAWEAGAAREALPDPPPRRAAAPRRGRPTVAPGPRGTRRDAFR